MAKTTGQIASLFLPIAGKNLLLPNAAVAEIIDYVKPTPIAGMPDWLLGHVQWRGLKLPVISYELANDNAVEETSPRARLAVINASSELQGKLPFFALVTQGIPRLVKVAEEEISELDNPTGVADLMQVRVSGEEASIPNLGYLESLIVQVI